MGAFLQTQWKIKRDFKTQVVPTYEIDRIMSMSKQEKMSFSIEEVHCFHQAIDSLTAICDRIRDKTLTVEEGVRELSVWKQRLKPSDMAGDSSLTQPVYDLCRLLIALKDDEEHFLDCIEMV